MSSACTEPFISAIGAVSAWNLRVVFAIVQAMSLSRLTEYTGHVHFAIRIYLSAVYPVRTLLKRTLLALSPN
jgi:hypothetical protein